eukprot:CAMPEP_0185849174 /NCGR_PEP_ID=MMETSP1354-20130828/3767_1 /TAXON_ID=708628 /ORGANISM="Erythrolobus madagascarensis, Strain CCMP3276" /LENGTH=665 /DNA_ID=CAMNT_0028549657 /DNA_START=356 /DNA_END=2353 /DNA_ORIENTATION=-
MSLNHQSDGAENSRQVRSSADAESERGSAIDASSSDAKETEAWWRKALNFMPPFLLGSGAGAVMVCVTAVMMITAEEGVALGSDQISSQEALRQEVGLFESIMHDIEFGYVDHVDTRRLFEKGVNAMLSSLDPYTQFENLNSAKELNVKTSGLYGGVGLGIGTDVRDEKRVMVLNAFEGYAYEAGIRPGDELVAIDGELVAELGLERTTEKLRGEPGSSVTVQIARPGVGHALQFELPRRRVMIRDVTAAALIGDPNDRVGYIKLQSFARHAGLEVRNAIELLNAGCNDERGLAALVLDLRGNPGGLLDGAVEVSGQILPKGSPVVATKGRAMGSELYLSDDIPALRPSTALAVLVNGQSASAAEIVAGAVQDLDGGVIVGGRTYGKGLVQNIQALPYDTALRYTVGRYYTPSGRCIQAMDYAEGTEHMRRFDEKQRKVFRTRTGRVVRDAGGIDPDVVVSLDRMSDLEGSLLSSGAFLDFADIYAARVNSKVASSLSFFVPKLPVPVGVESFSVDDELYDEFRKFVHANRAKYETHPSFEKSFDELDKMLDESGYRRALEQLKVLREASAADIDDDFIAHAESIRRELEHFIRVRFEPQSSWILADLKHDVQFSRALEVLSNRALYSKLLTPADADDSNLAAATSNSKLSALYNRAAIFPSDIH